MMPRPAPYRLLLLVTGLGFLLAPFPATGQGPAHPPLGTGSETGPARQQVGEARRVAAAIEALFAAAERNDLLALDSLYAGDSVTIVESTGINRGWVDYRDHHLAPEMKELKNFRYRPFEIEPHVSGPTAWAIFRYTLRAETQKGPLDLIGRGTAILEKRGDRWIVRHTHTASRARRPTDPPAAD